MPSKKPIQQHGQLVHDFLKKVQEERPDDYKRVCDQYPVINKRQWRTIKEREQPRGLLGINGEEYPCP